MIWKLIRVCMFFLAISTLSNAHAKSWFQRATQAIQRAGHSIDDEVHRVGRQIDDHLIQELPGVDRLRFLNYEYQLSKEIQGASSELKLTSKYYPETILRRNDWRAYKIPNAFCAGNLSNGQPAPYIVLISHRDPDKVIAELQPGGVCYDSKSCFENTFQISFSTKYGIIQKDNLSFDGFKVPLYYGGEKSTVLTSDDPRRTPFTRHTAIVFPYCTADVYAGKHTAFYGNQPFRHWGQHNIQQSLRYLNRQGIIQNHKIQDFILEGSSAGAIGALLNLPAFENELSGVGQKLLIADSAGLQFGSLFWQKFPNAFRADLASSMSNLGFIPNFNDGMISRQLGTLFMQTKYRKWNFAFLQANRDLVMSLGFGNLAPEDYEKNLLSSAGVISQCAQSVRCSHWTTDSHGHSFTLNIYGSSYSGHDQNGQFVTAEGFVRQIYKPVPQGFYYNSFGQLTAKIDTSYQSSLLINTRSPASVPKRPRW